MFTRSFSATFFDSSCIAGNIEMSKSGLSRKKARHSSHHEDSFVLIPVLPIQVYMQQQLAQRQSTILGTLTEPAARDLVRKSLHSK